MARAQTHEPETPMSREEFLSWVDQQPSGRFERIDGIVVAMAPERASHNLRKGAARDALRRAIREAGLTSCQVFGDGMTVQVENSDFEPDALLHCGPPLQGDAIESPTPWCLSKCCPRTVAHGIAPPSYVPTSSCRRYSIT